MMRKDAIHSCLLLLQTTIKRLEQTREWPEAHKELLELLQAIEKELSEEVESKSRNDRIRKLVESAKYLLWILLGSGE